MKNKKVLYRLEVNYYYKSYNDRVCFISSPIYNKKEGIARYNEAIQEKCIDKKNKPARVHLWKYTPDFSQGPTILKNY